MRTELDKIHAAFVETRGDDTELFSGEFGICLVQPDTNEQYKSYIERPQWSNLSRLVMSGWRLDHFWNQMGLITPLEMVYSLYCPHALPITQTAVIWNLLQPLKPIRLTPNMDYIGLWTAGFLRLDDGFNRDLLQMVNGIKVLFEAQEQQAAGLVTHVDFIIMRGLVEEDIEPEYDT